MRAALPSTPPGAVFSHWSAAALHGFPLLTPYPDRVHVQHPTAPSTVRRVGLTVHAGPVDSSGRAFHAVGYTGIETTAVEVARRSTLVAATVVLDHALRSDRTDRAVLAERVASSPQWGGARLRESFGLCDVRHESVGESYLAARAHEVLAPYMEPQHEFVNADGSVDRVDFWISTLGIVVEFDGRAKYEDPALTGGRSGSAVLWAEKRREDRVRGRPEVRGFVRVTWWHLVDPERLRTLFRQHGVPCG